ncbi:Berberine/berberine-like [Arabidopsis thaliana x Arabidopsis arenosa]|uniref:Berberine/berberine-like n=1 Tax=Arabidopsis thaliana x Arabidopsis arenosa TaxID=1240361 RepID=A0A8T2C5E5_9BRAS|nr:Berberine/berberine-like [Arabidopsis thaliana x Arabidopsis arenosa]
MDKIYLFFLLFFAASSSISLSSPDSVTIYEDFVRCFKNVTSITDDDLSDVVLPRSSDSFTPTLRAYIRNARFNTSSTPKPSIIILPRVDSHVQAAVICAKTLNLQLKIRSGGHDYDGLSYVSAVTFLVLDLSNFRNITIDLNDGGGSAWVQTGATLGELYYRIWEKSEVHAFPAGVCPTVGVGGHVSGGGYGHLIRKFGLTIDHVVDATIVDVNGQIHDRKSMGEDLFWAIRGGGGGSFGVILAFKVKLVTVPKTVTVFRVDKSVDENALDMVHKWQFVAPRTDPGLFMRVLLSSPTQNKTLTVNTKLRALYLGRADDVVLKMAEEFPELGLKKEDCKEMTWIQSLLWWMNHVDVDKVKPEILLEREPDSAKFLKRKSDYVEKEMTKPELNRLFQKLATLDRTGLVLNPYGGNLNVTAVNETAFPHRHKLYKIQHSATWPDAGPEAERLYIGNLRTTYKIMTPFVSKNPRSSYLNYRDIDIGVNDHGVDSYRKGEIYGRKYFGENFDRLVRVKTAVDPENFFRNEQSIPTLPPNRR